MAAFFRRPKVSNTAIATELYGRAVAQARTPYFYAELGVDDTPTGRLGLISLHVLMVIARLSGDEEGALTPELEFGGVSTADGENLAQTLMEVFVDDLDQAMREIGIGDFGVPKKVKKAMAQFYDAIRRVSQAQSDGDDGAVRAVIVEVLPGVDLDSPEADQLTRYINETTRSLACQTREDLCSGHVSFSHLP